MKTDTTYPLARVRADFPALRPATGHAVPAFFDGPGGTQVPRAVIEAVADYLARCNANTHGAFATSRRTDECIDAARAAMADFVGGSPRELVFGANMTTLSFAVSRALGQAWQPGDELIVTELDHQANIAPWRRLAEDRGLVVKTIPIEPESFMLDLERLGELLSRRTRLVAVGAASNAVGSVTDVRRVAEMARAAGALCYVDAVHFAPHRRIDVDALGCDFLVCSAYKFFGPHVGVLWARSDLLERLRPYKVPPAPDTAPARWETGTLNHEGLAGTAAAVDWIASLGSDAGGPAERSSRLDLAMERIRAHESALLASLLEGLAAIPAVRIHGPAADADRTPTVAFTVEGTPPDEVAARLAASEVYAWSGDFYAPNVIERLGLSAQGGVVRVGVAAYTSEDDVDRLVDAVARVGRA
jgi:cysteine desulfurase family protein (TIGR01976 family)